MKVQASYKQIGRNPFKTGFDSTDYYTKTVTVDDAFDLNLLTHFAIADTKIGYEFIMIEILEDLKYDNNTSDYLLSLSDILNCEPDVCENYE